MIENREVKSDVFSMLMEDKKNALEVYNALNGSEYQDSELIEVVTLDRGISLTIRNDAAFILDMHLNIYEHQSTYSPNIPLRALMYLTETLKPIIKNRDIYGRKRVMIPTPRFVVFYNGRENRPEKEVFKLSELFSKIENNPEVELWCTVYNINSGKNNVLLSKCMILHEYSIFVDKVRYFEALDDEQPIQSAISWCIENHILEKFLKSRGAEVIKNMTLDMTFEHREEIIRKEALEEGIERGIERGLEKGLEKGKAYALLDILNSKGNVSNELKEKIMGIVSKDTISEWLVMAASSNSVDEFAKQIL